MVLLMCVGEVRDYIGVNSCGCFYVLCVVYCLWRYYFFGLCKDRDVFFVWYWGKFFGVILECYVKN